MSNLARGLVRMNIFHQKRCFAKCPGSNPKMDVNSEASEVKKYSKAMIKFKKMQEKFQRDDGKPIFLKGGGKDRLLYLSTLGLCIVGLVLDLKFYASYMFD